MTAIQQLERDGFAVIPGVLTPKLIASLTDDVEPLTGLGGRSLTGVVRRRLSELPEDAARLTGALAGWASR